MSMREKISRAIHEQIYGSDIMWRESVPAADAVLDALMEPTEGMCIAGCHALIAGSIFEHEASMVFQAMLKAAKDGK